MQRHHVGGPKKLVEVDQTSAGRSRRSFGREGIVSDHRHTEAGGAPGDLATHPADADKPERFGAQLATHELGARPLAGAHAAVGLDDTADEREREGHGVLGGRGDVPERCVHHVDTARGGRRNVDVVNADAGATHDLQAFRGAEDRGCHLRLAPNDERVDVGNARCELRLLQAGGLPDLTARAEQRETLFGERVRDVDDAALSSDEWRPRRPAAAPRRVRRAVPPAEMRPRRTRAAWR